MKRAFFLSFLFLFFVSPVFADVTIDEGDASSDINVHTDVGGSGNVSTHIETNVNGKAQTFDSNQPGNYHIHVDAQGNSTVTTGTPSGMQTPTQAPSSTPTLAPKPTPHTATKRTTLPFFDKIHAFLRRIFSWL